MHVQGLNRRAGIRRRQGIYRKIAGFLTTAVFAFAVPVTQSVAQQNKIEKPNLTVGVFPITRVTASMILPFM